MKRIYTKPDDDGKARVALWKAICVSADDIKHKFNIKSISKNRSIVSCNCEMPDVATWQLVEAISLLCVILRADKATAGTISIFGKTGPVEIVEDGKECYLWAQHTIRGEKSALAGRPDIVVTLSNELPHAGNVSRIIEVKCVKTFGAQIIRSEFGKAYDLRVASYLIWSFYTPRESVIAGVRALGIDLQPLGFDTDRRKDLIKSPEALIARVAYAQEFARQENMVFKALNKTTQKILLKM